MANKYQSYSIQVKFHNGDLENLEIFNETEVDKTSYKQMLGVYHEIKNTYKGKSCDIEFCGNSSEGILDVIFTKVFKDNIDVKELETEEVKVYGEKTTQSLIESLNDIMLNLKERNRHLSDFMGLIDKKTDVFLHQLENKDVLKLTDEQLLNVCQEISDARNQRRDLKSEISLMAILNNKNIVNSIDVVVKATGIRSDKIEKIHETVTDTLKNGGAIKSLKVDEFKYKDFEDRMRIMKDIQKTHERVTYDSVKSLVYGYKKCGCK